MSPDTRTALEQIANGYGVTLDAIISPNRFRVYCQARRDCYRFLYDRKGWTTTMIARAFKRDTSSICLALDNQGSREKRLERQRNWHRIKAAGTKPIGAGSVA